MNKKLIAITLSLATLASTALAKDFPSDRWQWFYSNNAYTGKVDLQTLHYDADTDSADAWAVWERLNGVQDLLQYKIYFNNNTIYVGQYDKFEQGSDAIIKQGFLGNTHTPAPSSGDEQLVKTVSALVGRDKIIADKKAKAQELELERQEQAKQQKIEQEKKAKALKRQATTNRILGIFGL